MFTFKLFHIDDSHCGMKVGTDGVLLGAWTDVDGAQRVLDVGTGSGLLALMVAQRNPDAIIDAIEIDADACADAQQNVNRSKFAGRITVNCYDFMTFDSTLSYDLIISNPPFFTETLHSPEAIRASARHEGDFGVDALLRRAPALLSENGSLALIAPASRDSEIEFLAELMRFSLMRRTSVSSCVDKPPMRTLWQFCLRPNTSPPLTSLSLRKPDGSRSDEFENLTRDFYL